MFQFIRHSLTRRWVQSLSTLLAVTVSVGILFALYLLDVGVSRGVETAEDRLGADILVIPGDAWVEPEEVLFTGAPLNIYMDAGFEEKISHVPGVNRATPQFFTQTLNADCCSLARAARLIGFDLNSDKSIRSLLKDAKLETLGPKEVLTGARLDTYPGMSATILNKPFLVAASLKPTGTSLDYAILTPIDTARDLAKTSIGYLHAYWERYGQPERLISAVLVEVGNGHEVQGVARAISRLGDLKVVETAAVLTNVKGQMRSLFAIVLWGGLLIAASSVLGLFSRFFCMAWDRKGEWGLYRALGATRGDLKILVMGEAIVLTLAGSVLGVILGYFLYRGGLAFLLDQKAFPFIEPSPLGVFTGVGAILAASSLLGILSAWFPASQSARIEPSAAMAMEDID